MARQPKAWSTAARYSKPPPAHVLAKLEERSMSVPEGGANGG